jgi:hypothetical protein
MLMKTYFDGGNKVDKRFDRISLAAVCGTRNQWKRFETDWNKVLYLHKAEFLHTTDAISLNNSFSVEKGWSKKRVDLLIDDCVSVLKKHMEIPPDRQGPVRPGIFAVTLTIRFDEWLEAHKESPNSIPDTIEEVCVTELLSFAFRWGHLRGAKSYELYFDQGEPFYGHIRDRFDKPRAKQDIGMMNKVNHLGESDMRVNPPLQLADLLAWSINKANQERRAWHVRLHNLPYVCLNLQKKHLVNPIEGVPERIASWKLPKRRPSSKILS